MKASPGLQIPENKKMSSIFPFPIIKYQWKSPYYTLKDQLLHGSTPSAFTLPQGPWEHKCRGPGTYISDSLLEAPLHCHCHTNAPLVHLGTSMFLESENALGSPSVYDQLAALVQMGTRGYIVQLGNLSSISRQCWTM